MRILFLNWKDVKNPDVGGAEIIAFEFARRLVKDAHEVIFFSRTFPGCRKQEVLDGASIIRRGNRLTVYLEAFLYYRRLKKKPDKVVDMINTICWQTPLYIPEKKRVGYVNQLAKEVFFFELSWPNSIISYIFEKFEYIAYRNTKMLCYYKSTKDDLISFGIPEKNIKIFPMGMDHERYFPKGKKSVNPLFIFVARLVKMKRPDVCIKAMEKVLLKYPRAKLAVIGSGPDEEMLKKITNNLKLTKNVVFVSKNNFFIDKNIKDIKLTLMRKAWALLLPSVKEGWGMVVTEAGACGTPAIVSNVTGLKDSVINGKTGIILSKNPSSDELADALIQIIEDEDLRKKLGKGAIRWSRRFSWEYSYVEFAKLIR